MPRVPTRLLIWLAVVASWSVCSGAEIIHDRLVFAAANYKPLKQLRDAWAADAGRWLQQYGMLKRAYEREVEAVQAAGARAAALARRGVGDDDHPPAKRMRVRSAQVAKEKYKGSLTVNPGDTCIFVQAATNPLWSHVKMHDGRVGIISASKLEDMPEEDEPLPDPSDEELPDPSDDEGAAAPVAAAAEAEGAAEMDAE